MKSLVDRYVRSLRERDDHPEQRNDLGTLLCWILEREGFTIFERAFKHEGHELRVSKGRLQYGIDILAARAEGEELVSYRFVLKRGDVTRWTPGEQGTIAADLWLAASDKTREGRYGLVPDRIRVVAVHNGDRDSEGLGPVIEGYLADLRAKTSVDTDWWDARRIVDKIDALLFTGSGADSSFFPPALQPFVRLTLDSLLPERGRDGSGFDFAALDLLIERRLALGSTTAAGTRIDDYAELHRRSAELSLFALMVISECRRLTAGNTLPPLDAIERILCGVVAAVGSQISRGPVPKPIAEDIRMLLALYTDHVALLRAKLAPLRDVADGLAVPAPGEPVNYPLRFFRLIGYLAAAGLATLDAGGTDEARDCARLLVDLWRHNEGAALHPITDDQLIEIVLALELCDRTGMRDDNDRAVVDLIHALAVSRQLGAPLPALWQRARVPMRPEDVTILVETRLSRPDAWPSAFSDGGSTILSAALYYGLRRGAPIAADVSRTLAAKRSRPALFLQAWAPPNDAGERWYREGIERDGLTHVLTFDQGEEHFIRTFEAAAVALSPSIASRCGAKVVDRIAWKVTRTPPSMRVLADLLDAR